MNEDQNKVGLLGASLGTGNRGVSALSASVVKLTQEAIPGAETFLLIGSKNPGPFQVIVNGKKTTVPVVNYRQSPKANFRQQLVWIMAMSVLYRCLPLKAARRMIANSTPWIKAIAEARLVGEIRGGDSFSDIYGFKRFVMGSLPVLSAILVRGRVVMFPQTYGPFKSEKSRKLARFILRRSSTIISRDLESMGTVEELIGKTERCVYCPDVAFSLEPLRPKELSISPPLPETKPACLAGLNVNGLMFNGGYTRDNMFGLKMDYPAFVVQLAKALLENEKLHLLLVPHTFAPPGRTESDPEACRKVMEALPPDMRSRVHLVTGEYDQHEIKGVIGLCDFFVGSRMHACIAALSQGIPAVGVAYSKKFRGVFESVGAEKWIVDGRSETADEGVKKILELFEKRDGLRPVLQQRVAEARQKLATTFKNLFSRCDTDYRTG